MLQMSSNEGFRRLRSDILPLNYKLEIFPDFESFKFKGKTIIDLKVFKIKNSNNYNILKLIKNKKINSVTDSIELYSNGLNLTKIFFQGSNSEG